MILNAPESHNSQEGLNEKTALPEKRLISSLGSITNGFLFSTTPIILRILQEICSNMDESANSFIVSGWLYGSVVGILLFGYIGDTLGYYKGMIIASCFSFIGFLISAFSLFCSPSFIPFLFGIGRILLGIGCGGSIPIAYTRTDTSNKHSISQTSSVLLLLQSCSWLLGPIVFYGLLSWSSNTPQSLSNILFCVLCSFFIQSIYSLGCASIPSLCSLILLIRSYQTIIYSPLQTIDEEEEEDKQVTVEMKEESKQSQPSLWIAFLATGVTWFIYDFNSYGHTFFSRFIIQPIFPMQNTPVASTIPIIIAGLFGVPGQMTIHLILKYMDPRKAQILGFFILAFLFLLSSIGFSYTSSYQNFFLALIYHLTFFFSTCGPGSTTYILPSLVYSQDMLSLFHGICTCMGKLGGAIGSTIFPVLIEKFGINRVLLLSSLLSFLAGLLTSLLPSFYNCLL